jgi:hypothetical protein
VLRDVSSLFTLCGLRRHSLSSDEMYFVKYLVFRYIAKVSYHGYFVSVF